jgi:tripartite-type tricarboxylate transporter receptor subunit TctC
MTFHITRRLLLAAAAALALPPRRRTAFPSKPIRLVVPFVPGGVTDSSGRLIADALGKRLGQQVVVDNKPGASGNIGTAQVVQAAPDGYTLLLAFDGTMVINPHVFAKVPFDTLKDFAPVGKIGNATLILVANTALPVKTLQDVVALSKTKPLAYGTSGIGGTPHIAGEMLAQRTGAKLEHVPYKGGGQAISDGIGGAIPLVYTAVAGAQGHVKAGKLKAIAVSSAQRSSVAARRAHLRRKPACPTSRPIQLGRHPGTGQDAASGAGAAEHRAQRGAERSRRARTAGRAGHRAHARHAGAVPPADGEGPGRLRSHREVAGIKLE